MKRLSVTMLLCGCLLAAFRADAKSLRHTRPSELKTTSLSPLHVEGEHFVDARGHIVILRGVNVSGDSKVPPFATVTAEQLEPLPAWGFNVVRLLFTWEAFEPAPGQYNASYLSYYKNAVKAAAARGLYVLIDFHQDAMARTLLGGCGEGFPDWTIVHTTPAARADNGVACANWGLRTLFDDDMHRAWRAFYHNERGARDRYIAMVRHVAAQFANVDAVVGYDILNEPWGDEVTEISALYADAATAIRSVAPHAILFVEPHATVSNGLRTDLPRPHFDNIVYAPHFYDTWVMGLQVWLGNSLVSPFEKMRATARAWHVPLFIGEFGAPANVRGVSGYIKILHERLNESLTSGAQWVYTPHYNRDSKDGWNDEDLSIVDDHGSWRDNFKPRPYPQRIAGKPLALWVSDNEDVHDNVVDFTWNNVPTVGSTDIFLPQQVFFGDALPVIETQGAALHCAYDGVRLRCQSSASAIMHVHVRAAASHKV